MQVLVVKTSSMGDVLHTLPALTDAMLAIPGIHFDWVAEEGFAQIPAWHPAVDRVLPIAIRRWRKYWFGSQQREERVQFKRALQLRHYDAVIDAQGLIKSAALVTRMAKGVKHGQDSRSTREPLASWWYDKRHSIDQRQHAVERNRLLFAKSLGYEKAETPADYAIESHFVNAPLTSKQPYLVFLHATTRANKLWPEHHWRELIGLFSSSGIRIKLPWGTEYEHQRAQRLAQRFDYAEVLPGLTLDQIGLVIAEASAIVSVDTGLSHLAAALNRPNVTLYGPTDPGLIGGYGQNQYVIKAEDNDLSSVSADKIFRTLSKINIFHQIMDSDKN